MAGYTKRPLLRRFWLEFAVPPPPPPPPGVIQLDGAPGLWLMRRCGITAYTLDDALWIWRTLAGVDGPPPPLAAVIEDVDISTVLSEPPYGVRGVPVWRGMWHPVVAQPSGRGSAFAEELACYR